MKLTILLFLLFGANITFAQSRYSVFSVSDGVTCLNENTHKWQTLKKRSFISLNDSMYIPDGGNVALLDKTTTLMYRSGKYGRFVVRDIVVDAMERNKNIISKTYRELHKNADKSKPQIMFRQIGGVKMNSISYDDSLAIHLKDFIATRNLSFIDPLLKFQKVFVSKNTFYFKIFNDSDKDFYVNVLCSNDKTLGICYNLTEVQETQQTEMSIFIPAKNIIEIKEFEFSENKGTEYILFGSREKPFSWYVIQKHLKDGDLKNVQPQEISSTFKIGVLYK